MKIDKVRLVDIVRMRTGKIDSNAAVENGEYPFFTCSQQTLKIDQHAYDTEAVLLGGNNAAGVFPLKYYQGQFNAYQRTYIIETLDPNILNTRYLYYALCPALSHFQAASIGAATQYLTKGILDNFRVVLPPLTTQTRIASILSAYDDLIENNRRRIRLLESAARLIYKEWFVRLRFPGHENIKIVGGVPEGWERKKLGEVLDDLQSGNRPKGGAQEEGVPSIGAENVLGIGQYDFSKEKYVPEDYYATMRNGIVESRDVVVYKDGANIGRSSYFGDGFPHERCCINEHVFILRSIPEVGQNLLYFWVDRDETRQCIANLNANTAQPGVSQGKLRTLNFILPHKTVAVLFDETVEPIVKQIFLLARQIRHLTRARDILLPKLMNGDVVV